MKFSVIITVFNTNADYLRECIDSVLSQSNNDVEMIIVDDGSTSLSTLAVLDEYEGIDNLEGKTLYIKHKQNGGQGSARNVGLSLVTGDYVLFLDSDDYYMAPTFFCGLSELLTESRADVLSFQYEEFFDERKRPKLKDGDLLREKVFGQPADIAAKALLSAPRSVFSAATHTKAIRLGFLRDNNITAVEGLSNEDISLTAMILHHAGSYDRYNKVVYAYRRTNIKSISAGAANSLNIVHDVLKQFNLLLSNEGYKNNENVLDFLSSPFVYWLGKMISASASTNESNKALYNECVNMGRSFSYILNYSSRSYVRLLGVLMKIFGLGFVMFLLKIFLTLNSKHMLSMHRKVIT